MEGKKILTIGLICLIFSFIYILLFFLGIDFMSTVLFPIIILGNISFYVGLILVIIGAVKLVKCNEKK